MKRHAFFCCSHSWSVVILGHNMPHMSWYYPILATTLCLVRQLWSFPSVQVAVRRNHSSLSNVKGLEQPSTRTRAINKDKVYFEISSSIKLFKFFLIQFMKALSSFLHFDQSRIRNDVCVETKEHCVGEGNEETQHREVSCTKVIFACLDDFIAGGTEK